MPRSVYRVCGAESGADTPLPSLIHVQFRARLAECASNHHLNGRRDLDSAGVTYGALDRLYRGCASVPRRVPSARHRSPSLRVRSVSPRRNDSRHVTRTTRRRYGEITALTRHPTTTTRARTVRSVAPASGRRVSALCGFSGIVAIAPPRVARLEFRTGPHSRTAPAARGPGDAERGTAGDRRAAA